MEKGVINILAVGSHPDDVELGCGGTLVKHISKGDGVFVIILTNGERGGHCAERKECLRSLANLGIPESNIFFGNFPDGYVEDNQKTVEYIESIIIKRGINRVYTHSPKDRHQDHRNCGNAVSSAARKVPEIFLFEGPSTLSVFEPHYFIGINEEELNKKLNSLKNYESQIKKGIVNLRAIEQLSGFIGAKRGLDYGEAFEINHILKIGDDI